MNRININDGTGRWFDADKAKLFDEARSWNGQNHISQATGSQWEHEELYRTAGGVWILHDWSQWQGSSPIWTIVDDATATRWLAENDHHDAISAEALSGLEL